MTFTVVYDANVLYPNTLRDLLIRIAQSGTVQAKWTNAILDEMAAALRRNRPDIPAEKIQRLRELMNKAVRNCLVSGYEPLIARLSHQPARSSRGHPHPTRTRRPRGIHGGSPRGLACWRLIQSQENREQQAKGKRGLLVSWGGFTKPARQEARRLFFEIRLWIPTLSSTNCKRPTTVSPPTFRLRYRCSVSGRCCPTRRKGRQSRMGAAFIR